MKEQILTFGSLFSGIGGIDLGLERAGMRCKWQVEIDDYCTKVLEKHWSDVWRYRDVKTIKKLEKVDLICGGFPCQPISIAGKRKGTKDERWLWPEFIRIVRLVRPRYVLVENVPGLLTTDQGRAAQEVFGDLAFSGYDAEWDRVSAEFVGAPHLRWRVFVVAYAVRNGRKSSGGGKSISNQDRNNPCSIWENQQQQGIASSSQDVAYASKSRLERQRSSSLEQTHAMPEWSSWWSNEPNVGRMAHGVPSRVDRLRALGNAVVPQVAELIGRKILSNERALQN